MSDFLRNPKRSTQTIANMEDPPQIELTAREMAIAKAAAKMAVQEISDEFYKQVGKSFVTKAFILVGMLAVGFGMAKGWIKIG